MRELERENWQQSFVLFTFSSQCCIVWCQIITARAGSEFCAYKKKFLVCVIRNYLKLLDKTILSLDNPGPGHFGSIWHHSEP